MSYRFFIGFFTVFSFMSFFSYGNIADFFDLPRANHPKVIAHYSQDRKTIHINLVGTIDKVMVSELKKKVVVAQRPTQVTLHLHSEGGFTFQAMEIMKHLNLICPFSGHSGCQLLTNVRSRNICFSACTYLFAMGHIRQASENSFFLFHHYYIEDEQTGKVTYGTFEETFNDIKEILQPLPHHRKQELLVFFRTLKNTGLYTQMGQEVSGGYLFNHIPKAEALITRVNP